MPNTQIIGSGHYLPERIIGKDFFMDAEFYDDNGQRLDKSNEEVFDKFVEITEIAERRYINEDQSNSEIATIAAQRALDEAGINPESLNYIICASNFGDVSAAGYSNMMPNMAARVKNRLGITSRKCVTYDMIFGCPGWVEAMIMADNLIKAGAAEKILVIGSDTLSRVSDPYDRNRMIFSDGAGAIVVQATEDHMGILSHNTICDNNLELNYLSNQPSLNKNANPDRLHIRMQGRKIYEYALKNVPAAIKETIDSAGLSIEDIDKILIHQANAKMDYAMIDRLYKLYGITDYDHDIAPMTVQQFGNSSVATIPTMFDLIRKGQLGKHQFSPGGKIVMASVGAGMNINAIVYQLS